MKQTMLALALLAVSVPAYAQLGGLGNLKKAADAAQKVDDLTISEAEERTIGEDVSLEIRKRFGVVQDPAVHKYVSLIGTTLAKASERPNLNWTFIVLDTDGVNAFASPGGLVHITRGALGLAKNEAEVAGVLGHEIGHVVRKHTINAIKKGKLVQTASGAARSQFLENMANRAYEMVLENNFDRGDELDADKVGVDLTKKAGYSGSALGDFLTRLNDRNKSTTERNGLFASHPETNERIGKVKQLAANVNASVFVEPRYKSNIKYEVAPITSIATVAEGSKGLAGGKEEPKKEEEPKKKGLGLGGALKQTVAPEKQSTQVSASGGARGLGADRAAKGGSNPNPVKTAVSAQELATFKQGIA
jgi:beta-barrel assembly-enhancing protease